MTQSSFIVGALVLGFVLFLAVRGRLPTYAAVVWGPKPQPAGGGSSSGGSGGGAILGDLGMAGSILGHLSALGFGVPV